MAARIDKIVISELAATELLSPKPQPTHTKNCRFGAILRTLCAVAGQIANTPWRTPTKLMGDPDLPLLDTPSEAICAICFTFLEMSTLLHRSEFINVSIIIVASSSIGAGDTMNTMQELLRLREFRGLAPKLFWGGAGSPKSPPW